LNDVLMLGDGNGAGGRMSVSGQPTKEDFRALAFRLIELAA
jgi:hypothetical protein